MAKSKIVNQGVISSGGREVAARRLVDAMTLAYHRLTQAAEGVHADSRLSAGERSVLLTLEAQGPSSVSDLAKARDVSRQFMQRLVAGLLARDWVTESPNPRRRRSSLISPSPQGLAMLARIHAAEAPYWQALARRIPPDEVEVATRVMRRLAEPSSKAQSA